MDTQNIYIYLNKKMITHKLLKQENDEDDREIYLFECPACGCLHWFDNIDFDWNLSLDFPTVTSSILSITNIRCHLTIENGKIHYLEDSDHLMRGQTIEMVDILDLYSLDGFQDFINETTKPI